MNLHPDWLVPEWDAPGGVGAVMTTRAGGTSRGPFASLNLRDGLGDDPAAVADNLGVVERAIGLRPVFLNQVHGQRVLRLTGADSTGGDAESADACVTTQPRVACGVQVADCLAVLFAAPDARAVAAAHAGWRGLAAGVLHKTVESICGAADCVPEDLVAWLGPCIGPTRFEVRADVLQAFGADPDAPDPARFQTARGDRWLANLPQLARDQLRHAGVRKVTGGRWCTVEASSRFFSYRRDGLTGRMAAIVWIRERR